MIIWIVLDIIHRKLNRQTSAFISIPGLCSATVVGLVVITPAAGYIQPGYAIVTGFIGGFLIPSFLSSKKHFFHIDDTLDVFSCHGLGGIIGTLLVGLFSQTDINEKVNNGALYGNIRQLGYQAVGLLVTIGFSAACTTAILLTMHLTVGIRINRIDQVRGLDNVSHGVIDIELAGRSQRNKLPIARRRTPERMISAVTTLEMA